MLLIKWLSNTKFPAKLSTLFFSVLAKKLCITTTKRLNCIPAQQRNQKSGRVVFTNGKVTWTKTNPRSRRKTELTHQSLQEVLGSSAPNRVKMTRSALMLYIFANNEDSSSRRQLSVLWMQSMESVFDKGMCKTVLPWHSAWGCREFHSSQSVARSMVHNIWSQLER